MNESAIVKQPACAAAINSSGFVPLPSPNRAANEYGVSLSVPLCTDSVPLPSLTVPCQRAFALRCIICLRNGMELQFQDGIEFQVYRVARPCAGRPFRLPSIMPKPRAHQFDTLTLHAGAVPDPTTGARATPIYQTTSFVFPDCDHAAALFNMERAGHVYSRLSNPTCAVLEERIAALEGGVGAIATASGQAALHLAIVTLMDAGSHIVASAALYGGSHNLLEFTLPRFGISTTFVRPRDLDAWRAAIRPNTRLLFGETLGNPGLDVLDVPRVAELAHESGLPLLIDSTFTTPWLMRPFDHGADLGFHSATKFLSGHGLVLGGVLVDSGQFDWDAAHAKHGRFVELTAPYDGFHGMVFSEESTV